MRGFCLCRWLLSDRVGLCDQTRDQVVAIRSSVALEPAAGREVRDDAGDEKREADGEGADDPVELHPALEHEPVEQGENQYEYRRFSEERGTARGSDGDQVEERRWFPLGRSFASRWNQRDSVGGLGRRSWNLLR
jgi:hypothetical protein